MNTYIDAYRRGRATASSKTALIMLHEKMILNLRVAQEAWVDGDLDRMRTYISKTQDIVSYLRGCVDTKFDVGKTLVQLYDLYLARLARLFIEPSQERFDEMMGYFVSWRDTWGRA